jgi:hypothetical protein
MQMLTDAGTSAAAGGCPHWESLVNGTLAPCLGLSSWSLGPVDRKAVASQRKDNEGGGVCGGKAKTMREKKETGEGQGGGGGNGARGGARGSGKAGGEQGGRGGRGTGSGEQGDGGGGGKPAQPGDWTCPGCSANVFASKSSCYKCNAPKPAGAGMMAGGGMGGGGEQGDEGPPPMDEIDPRQLTKSQRRNMRRKEQRSQTASLFTLCSLQDTEESA